MNTIKQFVVSLFSRKFLLAVGAGITALVSSVPAGQKVTATTIILGIYSAVNIAEKAYQNK